MMETSWMADGACRAPDVDPAIFFPSDADEDRSKIKAARKVCMSCPVRIACLKHALDHHETGFWGGTTERQRRDLRKRRRGAA